jgi:divalent metal cation (Fe/Co/Zn/Cd) transporter
MSIHHRYGDSREHHDDHERRHDDMHGIVDPAITTSERGLSAIKWSFAGLAITAAPQLIVAALSGSVGLLADTIHNFGDAATAIPLAVAFWFAPKKPSRRFTFGYGRIEDLAGAAIILLAVHYRQGYHTPGKHGGGPLLSGACHFSGHAEP